MIAILATLREGRGQRQVTTTSESNDGRARPCYSKTAAAERSSPGSGRGYRLTV
ncbi:MAG: hypothetical protein JXP73_04765 [Deltaproteobacteria bacterium]|nr:hypothetical protein [Deltaproteobacteria bacterium]